MKKVKKTNKIIAGIIFIIILLSRNVLAANITKEEIGKNMEEYTSGRKVISVKLNNGDEVTAGNTEPDTDPIKLKMLDDKIELNTKDGILNINYIIESNKVKFNTNRSMGENDTEGDIYLTMVAPELMSLCFLSITDSYGIDSKKALKYYQDKLTEGEEKKDTSNMDILDIMKKEKDIKDEVFTYKLSQGVSENEENIVYNTDLVINLDKVNLLKDKNTTINEQKPSNPVENTKPNKTLQTNNNKNNEIAKNSEVAKNNVIKNKTNNEDLPYTGKNDFIIIAVILCVSLAYISYKKYIHYKGIK